MPQNMKVASFNQKMINTSEDLEVSERVQVVDDYAQKLINSGFKLEQTRNILVGGLTGYERKLALSRDTKNPKWKPLYQPASFNAQARRRTKLLGKSNWFERGREEDQVPDPKKPKMDDNILTGHYAHTPSSQQEHSDQAIGSQEVRTREQLTEGHDATTTTTRMEGHAAGDGLLTSCF